MARDGGASAATVDDCPEETPQAVSASAVEPIQNQLREKEQLVVALTERLEQAAEQLDRLRRTGADKGRRTLGGGGFPAEVVEEHKNTLEDLKRVIARWEDMQAEVTLGRIETQIVELRDLMVGGSIHPGAHPAVRITPHAASAATTHTAAPVAPRERPAAAAAPQPGAKSGGNAWWEAQKAALMGDPVPPEVQAALAANPAPSDLPQATATASGDLAGLNIPNLPAPIDFENITRDEALEAIRERDRIIQELREPLLLLQTSGQLPDVLPTIESMPEALQKRIAELETQWQSKFRQVELDLSLERARLAREQSALRQQQETMQKQFRKGVTSAKTAAEADSAKGDESASAKRRWFRFMGKSEDDNAANTDPGA